MLDVSKHDNPCTLAGFLRPEEIDLKAYLEDFWCEIGCALEGPQAASNGHLPASSLKAIPGGQLSHAAALRWLAMRQYIGLKHGVWIAPLGPNSSYRPYSRQQYYWHLYQTGQGNVAAYPGTSNHGWGNAVDVATTTMAYYISKYGSKFGWSHAEGARVGEWWHYTYVGGGSTKIGPSAAQKKARLGVWMPGRDVVRDSGNINTNVTRDFQKVHELSVDGRIGPKTWAALKKSRTLTRGEQKLVNEYKLAGKKRKKEIRKHFRKMREGIKSAAKKSGWNKHRRRARYARLGKYV